MTAADLAAVSAVAGRVHLDYPEDDAVFAERLALYPAGCMVLEREGAVAAYLVSHPWHYLAPPSLNARLGELPRSPSTYYIHDLALLPEARGGGAGSSIVEKVVAHAAGIPVPRLSLIAVGNSAAFWQRHGFEVSDAPEVSAKLQSYDDDARFMVRPLPGA